MKPQKENVMEANRYTQYLEACYHLLSYVARVGLPGNATPESLIEVFPVDLHPHLDLALGSPGQGLSLYTDRLMVRGLESDPNVILKIEESESTDFNGMLLDLQGNSQILKMSDKLATCIGQLSTGKTQDAMDAMREISRIGVSGARIDDRAQTITTFNEMPDCGVVDRTEYPATGTLLDGWTVLGPKELGVVMGGPGVGKTSVMISIGCGYGVCNEGLLIHFSEEIAANNLICRYGSNILNWSHKKCRQNQSKLLPVIQEHIAGTLAIESHTSGTSTVSYLIERAERLLDESPCDHITAVIVDYAALLKPASSASARHEQISENVVGMRAGADYLQCPWWTGAQPQRGPMKQFGSMPTDLNGFTQPVLGLADVGECWGIAHVADYVVTLNQTSQEREEMPVPSMRIHRAKVREPVEDAVKKETIRTGFQYERCMFV